MLTCNGYIILFLNESIVLKKCFHFPLSYMETNEGSLAPLITFQIVNRPRGQKSLRIAALEDLGLSLSKTNRPK